MSRTYAWPARPGLTVFLAALQLTLYAPISFAQSGSAPTALNIVNEFYTEIETLTSDFDAAKNEEFKRALIDNRDAMAKDIKELNWVEAPGERRFRKIKAGVTGYLDKQTALVERFGKNAPEDKARLQDALKKLSQSKEKMLQNLVDSAKADTPPKKDRKTVPIIDRSPYETGPEGEKSIWDR